MKDQASPLVALIFIHLIKIFIRGAKKPDPAAILIWFCPSERLSKKKTQLRLWRFNPGTQLEILDQGSEYIGSLLNLYMDAKCLKSLIILVMKVIKAS